VGGGGSPLFLKYEAPTVYKTLCLVLLMVTSVDGDIYPVDWYISVYQFRTATWNSHFRDAICLGRAHIRAMRGIVQT